MMLNTKISFYARLSWTIEYCAFGNAGQGAWFTRQSVHSTAAVPAFHSNYTHCYNYTVKYFID